MNKQIAAVTAALTVLSASAGIAQMSKPMMHKPMPKMSKPMMHKPMPKMSKPMMHKPMMAKGVYVCKMCKAYYTPMQAKKMGYKDSMGHKLTKMSKTPAGYMDGSKMKM